MQYYAVVYFPEIQLDQINTFRKKYDPQHKVIAPHITLIFPFSRILEKVIVQHLQTVTKDIQPFKISLSGLTKSFDDYLFLLIENGKNGVDNLHDTLYSGILAGQLQRDIPFIPHITLGYFRSENDHFNDVLFETAKKEAEVMNLNFNTTLNSISLIRGDGISPAEVVKTFHLG